MMNKDMHMRQQRLLVRSAELRLTLSRQVQVVKPSLALADQFYTGVQWLRRNPQWPVGIALVLGVLRPRRALVWGQRIWLAWTYARRLRQRCSPPMH